MRMNLFPADDLYPNDDLYPLEYSQADLLIPDNRLKIARLSPSFALIAKLLEGGISLNNLTWREFEEFVADLLQKDGYNVELGPGRKDGGVDIIAIKELDPIGKVMSVWQAKKLKASNKVDLKVIRELSDARNESKASKGIIVTSTFLTSNALERVRRDQYILGKVDRDDLYQWMQRLK